jgi:hypothetical protein
MVDLASRESPVEQMRLITEAVRKGALSFAAMEEALTRHGHSPGIGTLKRVCGRYRPGPDRKSWLDQAGAIDDLLALLAIRKGV